MPSSIVTVWPSKLLGCLVVVPVDYPLVPTEHPYPAAVDAVVAFVLNGGARRVRRPNVAVGGFSARGSIGLCVAQERCPVARRVRRGLVLSRPGLFAGLLLRRHFANADPCKRNLYHEAYLLHHTGQDLMHTHTCRHTSIHQRQTCRRRRNDIRELMDRPVRQRSAETDRMVADCQESVLVVVRYAESVQPSRSEEQATIAGGGGGVGDSGGRGGRGGMVMMRMNE
jgi:acetyl esterase/lipase